MPISPRPIVAARAGHVVHEIAHSGRLADWIEDTSVGVVDRAVHSREHRLQDAAIAGKVEAAVTADYAARSR
ncbi:hypothetical protein [Bradyrhizobium sp. USDA 4451]